MSMPYRGDSSEETTEAELLVSVPRTAIPRPIGAGTVRLQSEVVMSHGVVEPIRVKRSKSANQHLSPAGNRYRSDTDDIEPKSRSRTARERP
jgi:hypothetical protein